MRAQEEAVKLIPLLPLLLPVVALLKAGAGEDRAGGDGLRARGDRDLDRDRDLLAFLRANSSESRRSILLALDDTSRLLLRPSIPVQLKQKTFQIRR